MNNRNDLGIFEAILFAAGEPLATDKIADAMSISEDEVMALYERLKAVYAERDSGLMILKLENRLQLTTRKEYVEYVRAVLEMKRNSPLSQAAFEVLAVVAYNQPVTKSFVEQVRGVDCSGVMSSLCEKGLIEECGRLDLPGRPLLYQTTDTFLRCFSMESLADLPPIPHDESENDSNADSDNSDGNADNHAAANDNENSNSIANDSENSNSIAGDSENDDITANDNENPDSDISDTTQTFLENPADDGSAKDSAE